ncbi:Cytochrome oxidase complex assembly protein [Hirschfeldia incana]|nr:Cytochrome oxidase complex assembly protein [Hirschfeldia incana]
MFARRLTSVFKRSSTSTSSSDKAAAKENGTLGSFGRKAVSFVLITVTGGVALSALDDLSIYRGCSSKAMEKVMRNKAMTEAIGEPIEKGPWYNASLAVSQQRHSVSCSFPVVGPQGTGILHLKAVRNGEDSLFGFLQQRDWDILIMDALVHVPSNDGPQQTLRIAISDYPPTPSAATDYKPSSEPEKPEKS